MELAVWNFEDKWKLSTKQALFLLLFAASSVLCVATMTATLLRRLKSRKASQKQQLIVMDDQDWRPNASCGWAAIKTTLMGSLRWSRSNKWGEAGGSRSSSGASSSGSSSWTETPLPLLEKKPKLRQSLGEGHDDKAATWAAQSHNSESPVWQRPILMGGKCELPRFSGLILYDENGQLCDVARSENSCKNVTSSEVKSTAKAVRTTLRDLL